MKKIIYILMILASATACQKDGTLRYNNITMGNIDGETIISDQGNRFNIIERLYGAELFECKSNRVIINCDVLHETGENTYDIRLTAIDSVLTKDIKIMADSTPEENLEIEDPVIIRDIWYSGGYLNMIIDIAQKKGSETDHYINLVHDTEDPTGGGYTLILKHYAQNEVPSEDDRDYTTATGCVSFPIAKYIAEDSAKLTFKWKSFKFEGSWYNLIKTENYSKEFNWTRGGFDHTRHNVTLKSSPVIR